MHPNSWVFVCKPEREDGMRKRKGMERSVARYFAANLTAYDTTRDDIFACARKLTEGQLNLAHGTKRTKKIRKKCVT